ncbi:MAG: protein-L-isoaspartate O-methyltransferase [Pseudomonadota bacterium]
MTDFVAARQSMVDCQVRPSDVTQYAIIDALLWAPRERFVPRSQREVAYADAEIRISSDRSLMAPRTFAKMLEAAQIGPDDLVLDLAPGLGYSSAVISRLAAAVVAIEPDEAHVTDATEIMQDLDLDNVLVSHGTPAEGDSSHGPYDVIFINGGVEHIPETLEAQLKEGGRLVALVQEGTCGQCRVRIRANGIFSERRYFDATAGVLSGFESEKAFAF